MTGAEARRRALDSPRRRHRARVAAELAELGRLHGDALLGISELLLERGQFLGCRRGSHAKHLRAVRGGAGHGIHNNWAAALNAGWYQKQASGKCWALQITAR